MFKRNGITYRNLEEQVQANQDDINYILSEGVALNTFGIKIVEEFHTEEEFETWQETVTAHEYGDGVAVGADGQPHKLYVWTRGNTHHPEDFFLDLGYFPLQGPQGETGATGATGAQGPNGDSTKWYTSTTPLPPLSTYKDGDMLLITNTADIYRFNGTSWTYQTNIKGAQGNTGPQGETGATGAQGPQGVQGPQGDPGAFIHILGKVASIELLPSPTSVVREGAFLVGDNNNLYVIIGTDDLQWTNLGPLNVATYVTVDGNFVGQWNADTKLDKSNQVQSIYGINSSGQQVMFKYFGSVAEGGTIPVRNAGGRLIVTDPVDVNETANKGYVDNGFIKKQYGNSKVYINDYTGNPAIVSFGAGPNPYYIPSRDNNGNLKSNSPIANEDCANKKYVDDSVAASTESDSLFSGSFSGVGNIATISSFYSYQNIIFVFQCSNGNYAVRSYNVAMLHELFYNVEHSLMISFTNEDSYDQVELFYNEDDGVLSAVSMSSNLNLYSVKGSK